MVSLTATAAEPGWYASLSGSYGMRGDSGNEGAFTGNFTTGAGTTIPAGTVLASGTPLAWDTEFDGGYGFAGALGYHLGNGFRAEFEVAALFNDIDGHEDVLVGGADIDGQDAGVLITGSANLGTTVGALVATDQGDARIWAFMLNGYYDFDLGNGLTPYVGAGVGYGMSEVQYQPGGVGVADDDDGGLAWQLKAGLSYALGDRTDLYAEYRYYRQDDAGIDLSLLPATLDVENEVHAIGAGIRFRF